MPNLPSSKRVDLSIIDEENQNSNIIYTKSDKSNESGSGGHKDVENHLLESSVCFEKQIDQLSNSVDLNSSGD